MIEAVFIKDCLADTNVPTSRGGRVIKRGTRVGVEPAEHGWDKLGVYIVRRSRSRRLIGRFASTNGEIRLLGPLELLAEEAE